MEHRLKFGLAIFFIFAGAGHLKAMQDAAQAAPTTSGKKRPVSVDEDKSQGSDNNNNHAHKILHGDDTNTLTSMTSIEAATTMTVLLNKSKFQTVGSSSAGEMLQAAPIDQQRAETATVPLTSMRAQSTQEFEWWWSKSPLTVTASIGFQLPEEPFPGQHK